MADAPPNPHPFHSLSFSNRYRCPICQHGNLAELVMIDAFACDFCRHIFTANLETQILIVEDSLQKLAWRWTCDRWLPVVQTEINLSITLWVVAIGIMVLPALLVGLPMVIFEPVNPSNLWFPRFWFVATLVGHSTVGLWLLMEYYQWPPYITAKARLRIALGRFQRTD
jgi:hypothetical protein